MRDSSRRLTYLESARGIASVIVVFHHYLLAFYPAAKATIFHGGLIFTPMYVLVNGSGAVQFFFVLSGFVLSYGFFQSPNRQALATSAFKRLPRLMIPVAPTIIIGYLVLVICGDLYQQAAVISGSDWLAEFGNAALPPGLIPSLWSALKQCLLVFLLPKNFYYNSNLWTMFNEFYGSLLVFGVCGLFLIRRMRSGFLVEAVLVALIALFSVRHTAFFPFLLGAALAYLIAVRNLKPTFSGRATAILLTGAVIGFSVDDVLVTSIASLLTMLALLGSTTLARHLSGRWATQLGKASFPLYLVHTLVILSVSSFVFIHLSRSGITPAVVHAVTFTTTMLASAATSIPFIYVESLWVPMLNNMARAVFARTATSMPGAVPADRPG